MKEVVPIVPVCINTYYPPNQPTPRRCYKLGQAIRAAVESYPGDKRVGIIGSGGLSHFVVDEALDRGFIDMLRRKDAAGIQALPREKLNSGSSEIRNWICRRRRGRASLARMVALRARLPHAGRHRHRARFCVLGVTGAFRKALSLDTAGSGWIAAPCRCLRRWQGCADNCRSQRYYRAVGGDSR